MGHLLPIMISNDLEVVPLIAFFHFLKQDWHVVEWLSHLGRQLLTISFCEAFELRGIHFEGLELQLSLERFLQLCLSFLLSPAWFLRLFICIIFFVCFVIYRSLKCSASSYYWNSRLWVWSFLYSNFWLATFLVHWWQWWHTVTLLCTLFISCWLWNVLFFCHNRTFDIQFMISQFHWRFAFLTIDIFYKIRVRSLLFLVDTDIFLICLWLSLFDKACYSLLEFP